MSHAVAITCARIECIDSSQRSSLLTVEVRMNSQQMKEALAKFLECITDAEWGAWVREFADDILTEARNAGYEEARAISDSEPA